MTHSTDFYFQTYAQWRQAITQRCNIALTPEYVRSRIAALRDAKDRHTKEFSALYGDAYLQQVIQWFEQAEREG